MLAKSLWKLTRSDQQCNWAYSSFFANRIRHNLRPADIGDVHDHAVQVPVVQTVQGTTQVRSYGCVSRCL